MVRSRRRPLRLGLVALLGLTVATAGFTYVLFFKPDHSHARRADAVVVLAGAGDERVSRGIALQAGGLARVLVLSLPQPVTADNARAAELCRNPGRSTVMCFSPKRHSTQGEARALAELVSANDWRRIIVVTSRYHEPRARLWIRRCVTARMQVIATPAHLTTGQWIAVITHEWLGLAQAVLLDRKC